MAKGLRSKVKRRYRNVKSIYVDENVVKPDIVKLNKRMKSMIEGENIYKELIKPPNKFLHPDNKDAIIPQHKLIKKIDFRSEALPLSGFANVGNRRKYNKKEIKQIKIQYNKTLDTHNNPDIATLINDMHKNSKEVLNIIKENIKRE
ncbi:conserved protein, unknown function [Hepatocystis sp. ex Piliocolobus tephrosceles]|nr:conserved protein, unknown function [Hepatocystis sp. ex Piliocolobus tephrosceles]